jgi:hypothetical protein
MKDDDFERGVAARVAVSTDTGEWAHGVVSNTFDE